ncbi:adenylosuccinate synthetase [Labrys wisconsinensis]|uniref:Adenylosuccinate synthetase n=1 Tax=Labrys wisconsinensis TaxID=425677 RepID=A0ABU0JA48_9HYPH|nr:adenylosuccinate synthetase [Labrys wisconsinensis]MDQ0470431.1 adenylosuccinate synthase [Labrys wisconsinensis]
MPITAEVVIGAGYGDEGKGLLTDALAAPLGADAAVIRFNGGAQAGHTVQAPDGRRHVFHHVGSGALAGARSFLSRFFVANPILLREELAVLAGLGVRPLMAIDPAAPVTLPFDMMLNQMAERARGERRHGSCGLGFGETLERSRHEALRVVAADLARAGLRERLEHVRRAWLPQRLAALGLEPAAEDAALLADERILERWLEDAAIFADAVPVMTIDAVPGRIVFEGAQGLMLDQDRGAFPFVTRSNTGLRNVVALAREAGIDGLDVTYVTRAYVTRHGAGPLAHELSGAPWPDATNLPNPWQGTLRYGTLDLDVLHRAVAADLGDAGGLAVTPRLAVTCLDQVGPAVDFVEGGVRSSAAPEALARRLAARLGAASVLAGRGPTRADLAPVG